MQLHVTYTRGIIDLLTINSYVGRAGVELSATKPSRNKEVLKCPFLDDIYVQTTSQ